MGEISAALPKTQGARQGKGTSPNGREKSKAEVLAQAGVSTQDASRAEQVAAIPETEFEDVLATKEAKQESVSAHDVTQHVQRKRKEKKREKRRKAIRGRSHWLCSCGKNRSVGTIGANAQGHGEGNWWTIWWKEKIDGSRAEPSNATARLVDLGIDKKTSMVAQHYSFQLKSQFISKG